MKASYYMNQNDEQGKQPDHILVERYKSGDNEAFNVLVNRYLKRIYYASFRITRNHADAEEITQETFVKACSKISNFRKESSFYTWIYRIAVNLSLNHVKKQARLRYDVDMSRETNSNPDQLDLIIKMQRNNHLGMAITKLPHKQRMTVVLRIYEGLSTREVASIMNCSEGTVKANLFFALNSLKKELQGK